MDNPDRQKIVALPGELNAHTREMNEINREAKAPRTELKSVAMIVVVAALLLSVPAGLVIFGKPIFDKAMTMPFGDFLSAALGVSLSIWMAILVWPVLRDPPTSPKPAAPESERRKTEQPTRPATRCDSCGAPTSGKQCDHCGSAT